MNNNSATTFVKKNAAILLFAIIVITSFLLHFQQLNKDLIGVHVWRQTQTQWNTVNFYRHDMNILNPRTSTFDNNGNDISRFEFPIMQWLVALMMKIFGDAIIVTRLCYFTVGVFASLGIYRILKMLTGHLMGSMFGTWAFTFSPVFFYYTINPLPDTFALFAAIWFLYYFFKFRKTKQLSCIAYSAIFLMLAGFAKLQYLMFASVMFIYLLQNIKQRLTYKIILIYLIAVLPVAAWYMYVIPSWGDNGILFGIFKKFDSEKYNAILEYHKKIMFPDILMNEMTTYMFVAGCFFLLFYRRLWRIEFWMLFVGALTCVAYWLLELNMIDVIHDYYMMPFLPFLYIVIGYGFVCLWRRDIIFKIIVLVFIVTTASITFHATKDMWSIDKSYTNADFFIYQQDLKNAVPAESRCFMAKDTNPFVFPYLIDKRGYAWCCDTYSADSLRKLIDKNGVRYMYCTVRTIDSAADIQPFLKRLILQRGSVKVWELQTMPSIK